MTILILNEEAVLETLAFTVRISSSPAVGRFSSLTPHEQHFDMDKTRTSSKSTTSALNSNTGTTNISNNNNNNNNNQKNPRGVDRVSVCLGELCKCQEESSELILQDLLSRNLPYVVEDAPCLGACGIGAMVSIEYQDGGYDLVTGRLETFQAVGIDIEIENAANANANASANANANDRVDQDNLEKEAFAQTRSITSLPSDVIVPTQSLSKETSQATARINTDINISDLDSDEPDNDTSAGAGAVVRDDHGAVKRMREEAKSSKNDEITNPWINMALYLANKAKDGILK